MVTVDEVDASIAKHEATPVDANGDSTRKHMGVLPGAVLLTDSDGYDLNELPADKSKSLVFYCGNDACSASHHAAKKAIAAGYEHVRVMPSGIAGWVSAGKQVQQI
jgi:rhodanese-related sulfurtransferase